MTDLVGDRFVRIGAAWIDLATGLAVRIRFAPAGSVPQQLAWSDRCATLSRLRHPLVNPLIDYGIADPRQTFEAFVAVPPVAAVGRAGCELLRHAVRFLESQGVPLARDQAGLVLRSTSSEGTAIRGRPIGVVLQSRRILTSLTEVLSDLRAGGPVPILIRGELGSGLRTLQGMLARAARLSGFLPVGGPVIGRWPALRLLARDRHVCVMLDAPLKRAEVRSAADLIGELGLASARGHVVIGFSRSSRARADGSIEVDAMGTKALSAMVFVDPERGPSPREVWNATRQAYGNPGRLLAALQAARFPELSRATLVVHETPASYVVHDASKHAAARGSGGGRRLAAAAERAGRMAARGRHAAAVRLLNRALRVLEARREIAITTECALQLAWILRNRGRSHEAAEQFARVRAMAGSEADRLRALVGLGTVWTDDGRLIEAEALLRAALAAASLLESVEFGPCINHALARTLLWQRRQDEALIVLTQSAASTSIDGRALAARVHVGLGETRQALAAAAAALRLATTERERAVAARAMAIAQLAAGDVENARASIRQGLAQATRVHLPLLATRLRCELLASSNDGMDPDRAWLITWARSALRRQLPMLYREGIEQAMATATSLREPARPLVDAALSELRPLLELAHGAPDDRTAVERITSDALVRLRAATVRIVGASAGHEILARTGRPWPEESTVTARALASGCVQEGEAPGGVFEAAAAIRYADEPIGALACRWTAGASVHVPRATATLAAAALAVAPSLRGLLDRRNVTLPEGTRDDLIGTSPPMLLLRDAVGRAARAPFPVLVEGESGSGKELVARAIHRLGPRRDRRLCAVNCAALSDDLLEAELFGHARGAYTGAVGERPGLFEEADGGTLFLDEVGELSARAQAKLLRVLQDGEVRRVGENLPRRVDTRVVAATNRCLEQETDSGRFRADLRYRLDVIRIRVPPLRERATDIPALAAHFWEEATRRVGSAATLAPDTLAALARYEWPGNVRELQNVIASIAVHSRRRGRVTPAMLPLYIARALPAEGLTFEAARLEFERRFVTAALARAGGRRTGAARALGMSRQGLTKMMRRLGIERGD